MAKLPIPKISLPKIKLPFLRRKKGGDADANPDEQDRIDAGLVPPPAPVVKMSIGMRIFRGLNGMPGRAFVLLLFLGGIGGIGYWLHKNSEETLARRELAIPQESISLINQEERTARMAAAEEALERAQAEAEAKAKEQAEAEAQAEKDGEADKAEGEDAGEETADGEGAAEDGTEVASLPEIGKKEPPPEEPGPEPDEGAGPVLIPELIEESPQGPLPVPSAEGLQPWKAYSRPFNESDPRPRIAIIITNLGLSSSATEAAIQDLPGEITLAFQPFASKLEEWIPLARIAGHEVMLAVPMEPLNFPASDPGPKTLLTGLSHADNLDRLDWALSRFTGYVGVINHLGGRFSTSEESLVPVMTSIRNRGLLFVDTKPTNNSLATQVAETLQMVHAFNDRFLDDEPNRWSIDARLQELERIARRVGFAVGVGQAYPVTLERLRSWTTTLPTRGLTLAPITAVVDKQEVLN